MKITGFVCLLLALSVQAAFAQFAHDVSADSIVAPKGYIAIGRGPVPVVHVTNRGSNEEYSFPATCVIRDRYSVVYRDTVWVDSLQVGESKDVRFNGFTPLLNGEYQFCSHTILISDQDKSNDSTCGYAIARYEYDMAAISVDYPALNDSLLYGQQFSPIATFRNVGVKASLPRLRVEIRRIDNYASVFALDTILADSLQVDSSVTVTFGDAQAGLLPGHYQLAAIANNRDQNSTNDTAYTSFTIYVNHDVSADTILGFGGKKIAVGVPQPFSVRCTNHGRSYEPSLKLVVIIRDSTGRVFYRDTNTIKNLVEGETRDIKFAAFTALEVGRYTACATILMPGDEFPSNDVSCKTFEVWYAVDFRMVRIDSPLFAAMLPAGEPIQAIAEIRNDGVGSVSSTKIQYRILKYPNGDFMYGHTTSIGVLQPDSILADTGLRSLDNVILPAGYYQLFAIANATNDGYRANDTATVQFTVLSGQNSVAASHSVLEATLSPNPSTGNFNLSVKLPVESNVAVEIFDETGRQIVSQNLGMIHEGSSMIPIAVITLPNGWYHVRIHAGQNTLSLPLSIMR